MSHLHSPRRRAVAGFAAASAGLAAAAVAFASPAAATWEEDKERVPGNPSCEDLGYENSFKIEASGELPESGSYDSSSPGVETEGDADGFEVEIEVGEHMGRVVVDFESNTPVDAVAVKAGNEAYVYYEDTDPVTENGSHFLKSPKRDSISHVTFCWNGEDDDTPPTTPVPPTTAPPTTAPSTTVPADDECPGDDDEGDEHEGDDESEMPDECEEPDDETPTTTEPEEEEDEESVETPAAADTAVTGSPNLTG